ncbi:hypothetical protein FHW69_001601 [Luteibacter sp. Sphag1AF]|uniref:hypothetical protein n=1 Tax=Luteibacter sp. Sphag1AF TaxID=2587031 RepID=UPI001617ED2D|nr:hypothetical protein [Luteibacter sp. Sphag1AF]MBB3227000.1 hypothetical protein [Luteibacter sp. Sphag1AF]
MEDKSQDESEGGDEAETEPDPEEQPEADPEAEPEEPVYQVKVQGKVLNVTQSELLAGYSREADYRQKTASHAQEKAQFHEAATAKA